MSKIEVNQISSQCGSTLTIGQSGDTVTLASGASQTGFGRTGTVNWNTTAITADPNPAVSGTGYFVNTTSGAITITLPTSPAAGDIVAFADYALTWDTNNLILNPGSNKINGSTNDYTVSSEGKSLTLVYTDSTQGWKVVNDGNSNAGIQSLFVTATGGTVTCCGDYKIHTFTGPGTFCVSCAGNCSGSNTVDYLVVAGGGSGGCGRLSSGDSSGGAGAGGFRESGGTASGCYTTSPLGACVSALPVTVQGYPIIVGAGGAAANGTTANDGSNSIFSTITSTGGGGGGSGIASQGEPNRPGRPGGSGGSNGGGCSVSGPQTVGSGNTPPTSPPQGNDGGTGTPTAGFGGGGGAGATGGLGNGSNAGSGGTGVTSSISGSSTSYAGGGGGGANTNAQTGGPASPCGTGGRGGNYPCAGAPTPGSAGTANTGGGGGGMGANNPTNTSGAGGSGIVVIRYKFQ